MNIEKMFDFTAKFLSTRGMLIESENHNLSLEAGTVGTWILVFTLTADSLEEDSEVFVQRYNFQIAHRIQTDNEQRRDYASIESTGDAQVDLGLMSTLVGNTLITGAGGISFKVTSGSLIQGDRVIIKIGDRSGGSVGSEVFWATARGRFEPVMIASNKKIRAADDIYIHILCRKEPRLLRLLGPTVTPEGEYFPLNLVVFDINRNVIDSFTGTVYFDVPPGISGLQKEYTFKHSDRGIKIFNGVKATKPGVYRIGCSLSSGRLASRSNPVVCQKNPKSRIYWGDVHAHGWGDESMLLMYDNNWKLDPTSRHDQARSIGRFDYGALSPMNMPEGPIRDEIWQAYVKGFKKNDQPGSYVPFMAMEFAYRAGDRILIFHDIETQTPFSRENAVNELYAVYGRRGDTLLETHIGGRPPYYEKFKPEREELVEIASAFGNAEWLLQRMLQNDFFPAITGASDLHLGLWGAPRAVETFRGRFIDRLHVRDSGFGNGPVGAVVADSLNRTSLWNSLRDRNGYATTGDRIYVYLDAGGYRMGQIADLPDRFEIRLTIHGQELVERIDLIVGRYLAKSCFPNELDVELSIPFDHDTMPSGKWFYFRIHQANAEYAWTAPVWFANIKERSREAKEFPPWNHCDKPHISYTEELKGYLSQLEEYLVREDDRALFGRIEPVGIVSESMGVSVKFASTIKPEEYPVTIRWFFKYEIPKIRIDWGYENFGVVDCNRGPEYV